MAKLAEQAERYDDMVRHMKKIAVSDVELSTEERNLLSVAYKNVIGAGRASWRVITSQENKEKSRQTDPQRLELLTEFRKRIEGELMTTGLELIGILNDHLQGTDAQSQVFYAKMKGDYYRYLAEFSESEGKNPDASGEGKETYASQSLAAYKDAWNICDRDQKVEATNPIRLGLALNFSVFYYEILNKPAKACQLAREAFDQAIADLEKIEPESGKDSTLIMQLLRDNLTLWTSEMHDDQQLEDVDQEAQ